MKYSLVMNLNKEAQAKVAEMNVAIKSTGLKIIGMATNGSLVVQKVFKLYDSMGIPLEFILDTIITKFNFVIDWFNFVEDAIHAGWSYSKIMSTLEESWVEFYGREIVNKTMLPCLRHYLLEREEVSMGTVIWDKDESFGVFVQGSIPESMPAKTK